MGPQSKFTKIGYAIAILAALSIVLDIAGIVNEMSYKRARFFHVGQFEWCVLLAFHCVQLIGSVDLIRRGLNRLGYVAMVLCCIPCVSPLSCIGIPAGLWGLQAMQDRTPEN